MWLEGNLDNTVSERGPVSIHQPHNLKIHKGHFVCVGFQKVTFRKHFSIIGARSARAEKGQLYSKLSPRPLNAYVVPTLPCFYTMKLDNVGSITPRPSPYPQGRLFVSQSSRFLLVCKSRQEGQKTQWLFDRLKNRQLFYLKAPQRIRTFEFYTLFCWNGVSYYSDLQAHSTRPVQVTHFLQVFNFLFFFRRFLVSEPRSNTIQVYFWGANILKVSFSGTHQQLETIFQMSQLVAIKLKSHGKE